jgi:hypothetical protein
MDKWEYKYFRYYELGAEEIESQLNSLGSQGWEAVAIGPANILLKRRKP